MVNVNNDQQMATRVKLIEHGSLPDVFDNKQITAR